MRPPLSARVAHAEGADLDLIYRWMSHPHVAAYWEQAWTRSRWQTQLLDHLAGPRCLPMVVSDGDVPVAYVEVYRVELDRLAGFHPARPGDLGLHLAIGDQDRTGAGLGTRILRAVVAGLFAAEPRCTRILAEPDVGNTRSLHAFAAAGFTDHGEIQLPEKTAALLIRERG
ncbi:N-acetyltransferase [Pseudonocardiaceae bacterium YIM PH 21723]|nr:N-acetyltransferase [Pseudonocardiaceae bacterium YIM PH 21723]